MSKVKQVPFSIYNDVKKLAELCSKCGGRCCIGDDITISGLEANKLKEKHPFKQGILKSPSGEINIIENAKNMPCQFIGKTKARCILKWKTKPLSCRLFPLTFLIEKNKPRFYLSRFCPYVKEAARLSKWIKKTMKDADKELKTWTKTEKLCRSFLHETMHENHRYLIKIKQHN